MKHSPIRTPLHRGLAGAAITGTLIWSTVAAVASPVADLVDRVSPAVVTVFVAKEAPRADTALPGLPEGSPFEEFFKRFGPPEQFRGQPGETPMQRGLGSGFILEDDGFIVTNNHVVDGSDSVRVRLQDLREFDATVIGTDAETDLALLKINADGTLPVVTLGDSDAIRVGEDVVAVGNPFGLGGTVTSGIISAKGRDMFGGPYVDFLQTDAAINRGNSGGPLFNMEGQVVGVNSAIYSPSGGSVGVGFAVPSNIVADVVADLREDGTVDRGWLGVSFQPVSPDVAEALGLEAPRGVLIADVVTDSPADGALQTGDVILAFAGTDIETSRDLPRLVAATDEGETVDVAVLRDGQEQTVQVTIGALGGERVAAATTGDTSQTGKLEATISPLTAEARRNLDLDASVQGVVVTSVKSGGAADRAGLRSGDVILRVGNRTVEAPSDLQAALGENGDRPALLLVHRDGRNLFLGVPLAS